MQWTIERKGRTFGPYDVAQLRRFAEQGIIAAETRLVGADGRTTTAGRMTGLKFGAFLDVDPPPPLPNPATVGDLPAVEPGKAASRSDVTPPLMTRSRWIGIGIAMLISQLVRCQRQQDRSRTGDTRPASSTFGANR